MFPRSVRDDTLKLATLHLAVKRNNQKKSDFSIRFRFCLAVLVFVGALVLIQFLIGSVFPPQTLFDAVYENGVLIRYDPYLSYSYPDWLPNLLTGMVVVLSIPTVLFLLVLLLFDLTRVLRNRKRIIEFARKYGRDDIIALLR